jgi:hypothetical protein
MVGRAAKNRAERRIEGGPGLPIFERIAPSLPITELTPLIEASTRPGEAVLDLNGRGGWIARAAIAGQRRVVNVETLALTRLLSEVVVRPPDMRHVDAAVQAIAQRPLDGSTVKDAIDGLFSSRCPTCGLEIVLDALVWDTSPARRGSTAAKRAGRPGLPRASRREFGCGACGRRSGEPELRHAPPEPDDLARAAFAELPDEVRQALRARFPVPDSGSGLPDELLGLHSPRQLAGLHAILSAIESDTRAPSVTAALRLAFVLAVGSASRLNASRGKPATVRIAGGELKTVLPAAWRERNPWPAFLDGLAVVREFVIRLESQDKRSVAARVAADLMDIQQGVANVVLVETSPQVLRRIGLDGERIAHSGSTSRVRLAIGQAPPALTRDRLAEAYHATAWALGGPAAARLPAQTLFSDARPGRYSRADELAFGAARTLAIATPVLSPTGRALILLDEPEPRTLVAAALGGAAAGWRLMEARLHRHEGDSPTIATFAPPPPRRAPDPIQAAGSDPDQDPGQSVFAAPDKLAQGPFRAQAAAEAVADAAVELLKTRGEPAHFEDLLGELLVGLDRSGQLARLAAQLRPQGAEAGWDSWIDAVEGPASVWSANAEPGVGAGTQASDRVVSTAGLSADAEPPDAGGLANDLLTLIRAELDRSEGRRVRRVGPGQYWLGADEDHSGTAPPLTDRTEWAVFSLLSATRQLSEAAVFERTEAMFGDREAPDRALVRACLASYAAAGSTPEATICADQLERRSAEHDAVIATLADLGHRLGMSAWIGRRQQARRAEGRPLSACLRPDERDIHPTLIAWGPEAELERVDCAWYARHRVAFLFEVEWTAMLGDAVLVRHQRFPEDDNVVRFLVIPPQRAALVALKLERSPLLRRAFADRNWHVLKWDQLAAFASLEEVTLAALEPYVGLEAHATATKQLPLFAS